MRRRVAPLFRSLVRRRFTQPQPQPQPQPQAQRLPFNAAKMVPKTQSYHSSIFGPSIQRYRNLTSSSAAPAPGISLIKTEKDFDAALATAQEKSLPALFYFTAAWCGPCRFVSPIIEELSGKYPNVATYKIDIDEECLGKTLSKLSITAVPTLHFFKDGKKAAVIVGADVAQLKQTAENLYG